VILPDFRSDGSQFREVLARSRTDTLNVFDISAMATQFTDEEFTVNKFDTHPSVLVHKKRGKTIAEHILPLVRSRIRVHQNEQN